ncbi:Pre-mRNA-splicing factor cwf18 [Golovinomyces cichoracearum]|uniref:Pre-mRNA-splicing factor cwf18 n=1 Tax=Golovinomyces cichoracearum TaxID=62708 RepID=A0A420IBJ1_9PEZI|nr:Pre-mRNA-splicing factor cwf18 [Golovinomyces cichoracearum]
MSATHATLGAAADERKARLAKLKSLKRKHSDNEQLKSESTVIPSTEEPDVAKQHLSGRNYDVETRGPKLGFENHPNLAVKTTLEQQASNIERDILKQNEEEQEDRGVDLFKLQPKKPNWDLKRDLDKVLQILNVRTENAIARMVRERIKGAQSSIESKSKSSTNKNSSTPDKDEEIGIDGVELVERVNLREKADKEEENNSGDGE